jgi:phosphatidylserine decarboxylase
MGVSLTECCEEAGCPGGMYPHQYIDRRTGRVMTESLLGDRWIRWLYGSAREKAPLLFKALTSARASQLLGRLNFDWTVHGGFQAVRRTIADLRIDMSECAAPLEAFNTPRKLFERQIVYWMCRPMPSDPLCVVAPADARVLIGSLDESADLFIKEKFFSYSELIGARPGTWRRTFDSGDFAVFRLTPEKYHYNHFPVSGEVVDHYALEGEYHSCNPTAVVAAVTPYSKNKRVITVIDTDVAGGTQVGYVAMIEIVALMIGEIVQCYSARHYDDPRPIRPGMQVCKGQPKSLFRPGSSVDVVLFEKGRVAFDTDLLDNRLRGGVRSRYTLGWRQPLVETDVAVRSSIGARA